MTLEFIRLVKENKMPSFDKAVWQRSFHDRVIRGDKELEKICEYISNNPLNWNKDELFPL